MTMLYWHLGLKRTGTTSLQTALVVHEDRLAEAGLIYPQLWRSDDIGGYSTHHGLTEVIGAPSADAPARRRFRDYLSAHADKSILLSSEFVSDWLTTDSRRRRVYDTLALARSLMPVTCMLTLRRFDDAVNSLSLRRALLGIDLIRPGHEDVPRLAELFAAHAVGLRGLDDAAGEPVRYLKYSRDGSHSAQILRIVELPPAVRQTIEAALGRGPRLNAQLTRKGAAALLHAPALSRRCGIEIDRRELQRALFLGELQFGGDEPWELMGGPVRRELHVAALAAARAHGLDEYVEFFGEEQIEAPPPTSIDPEILLDGDLDRLLRGLRATNERSVDAAVRSGYGFEPA